jgi:aromatase
LEHQFEIKDDIQGLMENIHSKKDAQVFMEKVIHDNTERELWSIKEILESRRTKDAYQLNFQEEMVMEAKQGAIYSLLRDAQNWPNLLPHCKHVEVLYDDGENQEFVMAVDVRGEVEKIRSIRKCLDHRSIQYFQPAPPPVLKQHSGEWILKPEKSGTRVVSKHSIRLNPDMIPTVLGDMSEDDALNHVKNAINSNSMTTLQSINNHLNNL